MTSIHRSSHRSRPASPQAEDGEADALQERLWQLEEALAWRPVIDQATGIVMTIAQCPAPTAFQILVDVSQRTNTKLRQVARSLVAGVSSGRVDDRLRRGLGEAIKRHSPPGTPVGGAGGS